MEAFWGIALGVLIAVLYPVIRGFIMKEFGPTATVGVPPWAKKYGALLVFCLASALIVLAVVKAAKPDAQISFWAGLFMGIGYEAVVEKVLRKPLAS
jgi:predicted Na+-dependent transporter